MITDKTYLNWQKKLAENKIFRRFWVFWGLYSVLLIYAAGIYLLLGGKYKELFIAFVSFVLARVFINPLIYLFYKRQRPYQKLNFIPPHNPWLFSDITLRHNSFPSDHAASFAPITAVFFWFFPALGLALFVVMLLNGCARIIMGYHHIADILAGWVVGIISALVVIYWLSPLLFTH